MAEVTAPGYTLDLETLRRKRAEFEVRRREVERIMLAMRGVASQAQLAAVMGISQPAVSQALQRAAGSARPRPGFAGADPIEIAQRYEIGELDREQVIEQLARWEYDDEPTFDAIDGLPAQPTSGNTWSETVGRALDQGLIDPGIHDAVLGRIAERIK